jgi:hypothetical protein
MSFPQQQRKVNFPWQVVFAARRTFICGAHLLRTIAETFRRFCGPVAHGARVDASHICPRSRCDLAAAVRRLSRKTMR